MKTSPFNKLKSVKRNQLPEPPVSAPVVPNLEQPEAMSYVDGRTLRRTGMTEPLYLRLQPGVRDEIKLAAARDKKTMGQLMTEAFRMHEAARE